MTKRIVITAADIISSNASSYADFRTALIQGKSVLSDLTHIDVSSLACKQAFQVQVPFHLQALPREFLDKALVSLLVHRNEELFPRDWQAADIFVGSTMGAGVLDPALVQMTFDDPGRHLTTKEFMTCFSASVAEHIRDTFQLRGQALTVCDACASGTTAIGIARNTILYGEAPYALVVGVNLLFDMPIYGFSALRLISPTVCSPFDQNRRGLIPGEGVALLFLEELESARQRKARILAEVIGFGASADAYHITAPDKSGAGAARAMERALKDAGIRPADIDYINAHGTGTKQNDLSECLAVNAVFRRRVPCSSVKSMLGHSLGAAGVIEGVAALATLEDQVLPPTINYHTPDPDCAVDCVPNLAREAEVSIIMSNSFGFGGNNSSIILKKYKE